MYGGNGMEHSVRNGAGGICCNQGAYDGDIPRLLAFDTQYYLLLILCVFNVLALHI